MKKIIIFLTIGLMGCANLQEVRRPENKLVIPLSVNYQEAYRLVSESFLTKCNLIRRSVQPMIFTDAKYAIVTHEVDGVVFWSFDLKYETETTSIMEFYPASNRYRGDGDKFARHINKKDATCYFD